MSKSAISQSTPERIIVRGLDLTSELMGPVNLGDMAFLELKGRPPPTDESVVFNAMLVSLVEHGITPNTLAARLSVFRRPRLTPGCGGRRLAGSRHRLRGHPLRARPACCKNPSTKP